MSGKCAAIGYCFSFLAKIGLIVMLEVDGAWWFVDFGYQPDRNTLTVYPADGFYFSSKVKCIVSDMDGFTTPSLQSFIQATTTGEGQELILNGLAVYSNACQPLEDVRNAQI